LQYLLLVHKASAFKQDNSGATLFHHAVEKGNTNVLKMLLTLGGDISSGIEIADNAGRTPIFEALDNNSSGDLIRLLIKKR
jgi:ankyrin repeat protein